MREFDDSIREKKIFEKELDLNQCIYESFVDNLINKTNIDTLFTEGAVDKIKDFFNDIIEKFRQLIKKIKLKLHQMKLKRDLDKINKDLFKKINMQKKYSAIDEQAVLEITKRELNLLAKLCKKIISASDFYSAEEAYLYTSEFVNKAVEYSKTKIDLDNADQLFKVLNDDQLIKTLEITHEKGISLTRDTCEILQKKMNGKLMREDVIDSIKDEAIKDEQLDKEKINLIKRMGANFSKSCSSAVNTITKNRSGIIFVLHALTVHYSPI